MVFQTGIFTFVYFNQVELLRGANGGRIWMPKPDFLISRDLAHSTTVLVFRLQVLGHGHHGSRPRMLISLLPPNIRINGISSHATMLARVLRAESILLPVNLRSSLSAQQYLEIHEISHVTPL